MVTRSPRCVIVAYSEREPPMKRPILLWPALGLFSAAVACLMASRPAPRVAVRRAVAFDMSRPLETMEQFIPDKAVVIHPAVETTPALEGSASGPGTSLGTTPPSPPPPPRAGRAGRGTRAAPPIPPPPPAPEVNAGGGAGGRTRPGTPHAIPPPPR